VAIWDLPGRLWSLGRKFEDLLRLQATMRAALDALEVRVRALEEQVTRLEASHPQIIAEAKAAAGAASTLITGAVIADIVTRITRLEVQQDELRRRLVPPG
jgi:hypothetical protein